MITDLGNGAFRGNHRYHIGMIDNGSSGVLRAHIHNVGSVFFKIEFEVVEHVFLGWGHGDDRNEVVLAVVTWVSTMLWLAESLLVVSLFLRSDVGAVAIGKDKRLLLERMMVQGR